MSELEVIVEKRDGLGLHHAQPAQGDQRPQSLRWSRRSPRHSAEWVRRRRGAGGGDHRCGRAWPVRRRRHRLDLPRRQGRRAPVRAEFWREEYILNAASRATRKPYVAIMDGIVMGGGVGVSAHGSIRIVTERSMIGMPETGIGFVPDVGRHLPARPRPGRARHAHRADHRPARVPATRSRAGFADHFIPSEKIEHVPRRAATASVPEALAQFAEPAPVSELLAQQGWIDAAYSADNVADIVEPAAGEWSARGGEGGRAGARRSRRPRCAVTLRSLRHAEEAAAWRTVLERGVSGSRSPALASHDLVEGIRAQVVDKDRNPQWSPATLDDVTAESRSTPTSPHWATASSDSPFNRRQLITAEEHD